MSRKVLLVFATLALVVASAKTYSVKLHQDAMLGATELKAGDYKVEVGDNKVVLRNGRQATEAPVKVEEGNTKFATTSVRYANTNGKFKIQEIRLGGTSTKLVISD